MDGTCAAGATLMLVSWARGGSLFSRGRGYNVSLTLMPLHLLLPTPGRIEHYAEHAMEACV